MTDQHTMDATDTETPSTTTISAVDVTETTDADENVDEVVVEEVDDKLDDSDDELDEDVDEEEEAIKSTLESYENPQGTEATMGPAAGKEDSINKMIDELKKMNPEDRQKMMEMFSNLSKNKGNFGNTSFRSVSSHNRNSTRDRLRAKLAKRRKERETEAAKSKLLSQISGEDKADVIKGNKVLNLLSKKYGDGSQVPEEEPKKLSKNAKRRLRRKKKKQEMKNSMSNDTASNSETASATN